MIFFIYFCLFCFRQIPAIMSWELYSGKTLSPGEALKSWLKVTSSSYTLLRPRSRILFFLIYFIYYSVFLFCPAVLGPGRLLHVLLPSQISDLVSSSGTLSCTKVNSAAVMHYIREHSLDNLSLSCTCAARTSSPPCVPAPSL